MINDDTIKLLRECNSGVKMGVISLDDVLGHVHGSTLKTKNTIDKFYPKVQYNSTFCCYLSFRYYPKKNGKTPWVYYTVLYKRRNAIERFSQVFYSLR